MSDIQAVTARTTREAGRYVLEGPGKVFLSDSALIRQKPSVAPNPIEFLVSALASCAIASVESDARDLDVAVRGAGAEVTATRDEADESRFRSILVAITVEGVDQGTAERLTAHFIGHCPVYNTIRRGGPIEVAVRAVP
ncbi:hypothetical protein OPKNFCMD_0978 [Methylobacterium crusticola]|uniref:OsmC family peroxiredoxin n=1 Tax=Methylobacterium crusticola TaxID=1697972 RepID=A0ABQ4QUB0_9HYPH|nr:OsmC family protein [Methylobacterium crusticola]GJD48261.1 hypothetical protein OPKNFCMD_0978 [Methylobacterium crusticola]